MTVQINKTANTHRGLPVCTVFYILSGTNDWLRSATGRCESHGHDSISRNAPGRALLLLPPLALPPLSALPPPYLSFHALFIIVRCFYHDRRYVYIYKPDTPGKTRRITIPSTRFRQEGWEKVTSVILSRGCEFSVTFHTH